MKRIFMINPPVLAADPYQVDLYAEAIPFGLIQIATYLRQQGHQVEIFDMMAYPDRNFSALLIEENLWGLKPAGAVGVDVNRPVYLIGSPLSLLEKRLGEISTPDEIYVTCCIAFNFEPAHAVVQLCKKIFPRSKIIFGGAYPTLYPEQARRSGADEIFCGRFREAEPCQPDVELLGRVPPVWLFRLVLGCKYRCSFCINSATRPTVVGEPESVAREVIQIHRRLGIEWFSCWDPNVMLRPDILERFLDAIIAVGSPVKLKFDMGIQPNLLTERLAKKMKRAGVVAMTIPFESADAQMLRRFGKSYRIKDSQRAVGLMAELGMDLRRCHCTWIIGIPGESFKHLYGTYFAILNSGGKPTPFPLTPIPGTREYKRHEPLLAGKDLSLLNGHLWPLLNSAAEIELYDLLLRILTETSINKAETLAKSLPSAHRRAFEQEAKK